MGFLSAVFNVVSFAVGTLVTAVATGVGYVAAKIKTAYDHYYEREGGGYSTSKSRQTFRSIDALNQEIFQYEDKRARDGRLNMYDAETYQRLLGQRNVLAQETGTQRELRMAEELQANTSAFDTLHVTDQNIQVLLFHVGQSVSGKTCATCGLPMRLEWRRTVAVPAFKDFFWGCASFYLNGQGHIEAFQASHMDLFTRTDREEFSVSASQLNSLALHPRTQTSIERRVREHKNESVETYTCPVHHVPMILREKRDAAGLLDQFFLSCPYWGAKKCNHVMKVKNAAQLASLLESTTGRGIL